MSVIFLDDSCIGKIYTFDVNEIIGARLINGTVVYTCKVKENGRRFVLEGIDFEEETVLLREREGLSESELLVCRSMDCHYTDLEKFMQLAEEISDD